MDQFPRNSHRPVNPERKPLAEEPVRRTLEPVVDGSKVTLRKKSLGHRILKTFFTSDSSSVFGYLAHDVLIPLAKSMLDDLVTQGIKKALWNDTSSPRPGVRPTSYRSTGYTSYDRYATSRPTSAVGPMSSRRPTPREEEYNTDDIVLPDLNAAKMVLEQLDATIRQYGAATVADLLNLSGKTADYPDHSFGWMDMHGISYRRVREGYLIVTPEPEDLND